MKSISPAHGQQHQVWMGAMAGQTTERDAPHHANFAAPPRPGRLASSRGEHLTDIVLAVVYVAGCALMGWAGAAWL